MIKMPAIFKTVYFPLRCFFSSFLLNPFALSTSTIHKKRHKQKYKNNLVSLNCPNCVDYFLLWFLRVCILLYHPLVCRILKKKKKKLYIFLVRPTAYGSSWARDQNHATATTQATPVTMLDP